MCLEIAGSTLRPSRVWEMFRIIVDERKKREIDPTMDLLRQCISELDRAVPRTAHSERLQDRTSFLRRIDAIYTDVRKLPVGNATRANESARRVSSDTFRQAEQVRGACKDYVMGQLLPRDENNASIGHGQWTCL